MPAYLPIAASAIACRETPIVVTSFCKKCGAAVCLAEHGGYLERLTVRRAPDGALEAREHTSCAKAKPQRKAKSEPLFGGGVEYD